MENMAQEIYTRAEVDDLFRQVVDGVTENLNKLARELAELVSVLEARVINLEPLTPSIKTEETVES